MRKYHDQKIDKRAFMLDMFVVCFNSRLHFFSGNLKSNWTRTFKVTQLFPHGAVAIENRELTSLKVNGQRIYFG